MPLPQPGSPDAQPHLNCDGACPLILADTTQLRLTKEANHTQPAHCAGLPRLLPTMMIMSSHIDNYKTTPAHQGAQPHTACSPKRAVRLTPNAPAEKQHQIRTKNILFNLTILTFIQDFSRTY